MGILRKIEKDVKVYLRLITDDQETARERCTDLIKHIENSEEILENFIESKAEIFDLYCKESVDNFCASTDTFFLRLMRSINMSIINSNLDRISKDISKARILKEKLAKIRIRFEQYEYLKQRVKKE